MGISQGNGIECHGGTDFGPIRVSFESRPPTSGFEPYGEIRYPDGAVAYRSLSQTLARRARAGAPDALATLYGRYAASLLATAHWLTGSLNIAEDVVRDVFTGLPTALGKYDGAHPFEDWLKRLTARVALMRVRHRAWSRRRFPRLRVTRGQPAFRPAERAVDGWNPDESIDPGDLQEALLHLPTPLRFVFVLRQIEGYTNEEISQLMGVSAAVAEVRFHRARQLLTRMLCVQE